MATRSKSKLLVDEVVDGIRSSINRLESLGCAPRMTASLLAAIGIIYAARHVKVTPDGGDEELIQQLERAAKACDSSLLEAAALRLRRHQSSGG